MTRPLLCLALCLATVAHAGLYADDMAKCLVKSTSNEDKTLLMRWLFSMMTLHPQVSDLAMVPEAKRAELSERTAKLIQSLLTKTCLAETREALKYEGPSTIEASFNVLGQVAGRGLLADPEVAAGLADMGKYVDKKALEEALRPTSTPRN